LSDGNKRPGFDVCADEHNVKVGTVEVLQESGKERSVNTANCGEMDNICSGQADGVSEFLLEKTVDGRQ